MSEIWVNDERLEWLYNELEDGTLEITKYLGESSDVTIPEQIAGKNVTTLTLYSDRIEKIHIPGHITNIVDCCSYQSVREVTFDTTFSGEINESAFADTYWSHNEFSPYTSVEDEENLGYYYVTINGRQYHLCKD